MKENQFTVDLGNLKLTDDQRSKINGAIQKAVSSQLATINLKERVALYPVFKLPKGPILNGIIVRPIELNAIDKLIGK